MLNEIKARGRVGFNYCPRVMVRRASGWNCGEGGAGGFCGMGGTGKGRPV